MMDHRATWKLKNVTVYQGEAWLSPGALGKLSWNPVSLSQQEELERLGAERLRSTQ